MYIMSTDLELRIDFLVDLLTHIHTECKTLADPDEWNFHKCSSIAMMHIFMEKHGIYPLMIALDNARAILGETLMLDRTILNALTDAGCRATKVRKSIQSMFISSIYRMYL